MRPRNNREFYTTLVRVFVKTFAGTLIALSLFSFVRWNKMGLPLWQRGKLWHLPSINAPLDWPTKPFFYSIAPWPTHFEDKPIVYRLLYEKGPPRSFIGHVVSYWDLPDIQVILEGPKTPEHSPSLEELKNCIIGEFSFSCLKKKEYVLKRHLQEMNQGWRTQWTIEWFRSLPSTAPEGEWTQGIHLRSQTLTHLQDRFILIHPTGFHQTVIFNRPSGETGEKAYLTLLTVIQNLRLYSDLSPGKFQIDRELATTHLNELALLKDPSQKLDRLAQVQSLLMSKISVDPRSIDSYFHLAGTSSLLSRTLNQKLSTDSNLRNLVILQNLESSFHYAKDVAEHDPKTFQIFDILKEIRNR